MKSRLGLLSAAILALPGQAMASDPTALIELAAGAVLVVVVAAGVAWFLLRRATDTWVIRPETRDDAEAIESITVAAFRAAEHSNGQEQAIVRALRQAGVLTLSLVADNGCAVLGHVAVSPVRLSGGEPGWYGLGPVSVHPHVQRQGIGRRLVARALDELRARGAAGCVVLGDPGYYSHFGFAPAAGLVLPGVPAEYFQALAFSGGVPAGEVTYHAAFGTEGGGAAA